MMTRKEMLRIRLEEAYRLSRYHSLLGSLKGVSEDDARWTPPAYRGFPHMTGSIVNLLYHSGGDKLVLMSASFGDGSMTWERVQARFDELGRGLAAARSLAEEGHGRVLAALDALPEEQLDASRPYYGGKSHTASEVFAIVAEHDLYHAGQINYVRCLLAGEKASR